MNRILVLGAVLAALVVPALGQSWLDVPEMKVKVYATPAEAQAISRQVLEFYKATPDWFIGAVTEPVYKELVAKGYRIEVIVPDVRARAMEFDGYFHTYTYFRDTWGIFASAHTNICVFDTIGTTAGGRIMVAMKISDNPTQMEGEPRICFDCSIHGNENNGCEIADYVMKTLVNGYGVDPSITYLVNSLEIWIVPMSNPDGLVSRSRYNDNGIDLNRDYGYAFDEGAGGGSLPFQETETQAFYNLAENNPMAAWSQYHTGATDAMQPWGYTTRATQDSIIQAGEMNRYGQITGYAAGQISRILYSVYGGSTDWYYGARGALGYAIEVCDGQPSAPSEIDSINHANWTAMKEEMRRVLWGISGYVTDSISGLPVAARVSVSPPDWFTYTDSIGFFHKNVHGGTYSVTAVANGYASKTVTGVVVPTDSFISINIALAPDTAAPTCAFKAITCKLNESPANTNTTYAYWALGPRDSRRFSIGNGGYASFDMGAHTPILNGAGNDFTVVEGDGDPEACSVYVSNGFLGPWHYVGFGTGTQSYDLAAAGQSTARFVRIADDGNGGSGANAGFDLDAIEATVVNAPAVVYQSLAILDSLPGGNNDGKLDPGENAGLTLGLKNVGRVGVTGVTGVLRTSDAFVSVLDSTASYGTIAPDSIRVNTGLLRVAAAPETPREHVALMKFYITGTDYADSVTFDITVGETRAVDPIPDGPRTPTLYWAYDDGDAGYSPHPTYSWVEIRPVGTRLTLSDDQTTVVSLPPAFGPFRFYGQNYTQVSVCSNGWVGLGSTTVTTYDETELPNSSMPPMFAMMWNDMYPQSGGGVWYYHDAANHRFVVEYDSVPPYSNQTDYQKFELVLSDTTQATADGNCTAVIQYQIVSGMNSCTVGDQDPTTTIAIQCLFDGAYNRGCATIAAGRAIKFAAQDPTGLSEAAGGIGLPAQRLAVGANPVGERAVVSYNLASAGRATVAVYDNAGRLVRTLAGGEHRAGQHRLEWDRTGASGHKVAAGVYWVRLETVTGSTAAKAVLVR